MRRILATFLIAIIASGFLLPVVMSAGENSTPACCRPNGKHHCLMMQVSAQEDSARSLPRIHGPVSVCPYYDPIRPPRISAEAVPQTSAPEVPVIDRFILSVLLPAHGLQFVDSALTRGPPVSFLQPRSLL